MRKSLLILFLFCGLLPVVNSQDIQRFSERQIIGTARYVGMGGAMTAIGGDASAVQDNPAGLGLYRRSEVMLTLGETIDRTTQIKSGDIYQRARFAIPQVSAIWAWGHPSKQRGMIYNNFMFSIQRLANYNRDLLVKGAGMGMVEGIINVIPNAKVGHIGLYRNEETLEPVEYYYKMPDGIADREAMVIDPMLATGGSASATIDRLKKDGVKKIKLLCIVAAPIGIKTIETNHPDVEIFCATVDRGLNENAYIVPGLGDAGDRIYGTK